MSSSVGSTDEVEALRLKVAELEAKLTESAPKPVDVVAPYSRSFGRTLVRTILRSPDGGASLIGRTLRVGGWVKTGREAGGGAFAFLDLSDGSCFENLQVMLDASVAEAFFETSEGKTVAEAAAKTAGAKSTALGYFVPTSTSLLVEGTLAATPEGTIQKVELKASKIVQLGPTNAHEYPLAKKRQSFEFLREKMHLRPRTNTIGAVARIRNALAAATHEFFQSNGFLYVHSPIITSGDAEGAGEMFQVTTLLPPPAEAAPAGEAPPAAEAPAASPEEVAEAEAAVARQAEAVRALKAAAKQDPEAKAGVKGAVELLLGLKAKVAELKGETPAPTKGAAAKGEVVVASAGVPTVAVDYSKDFFGRPAYLTVSGQLNGEYYACALSSIYTFGPTFRAENSHTSRHLAEFWMIEPEIAYADLQDVMRCAEDYVRFCCRFLLENTRSDLNFINAQIDRTAIQRLEQVASTPFVRCSYTEAVSLLEEAVASGEAKFEYPVSWGVDLASEHERFLTEKVFKSPVIVYDYPREIKAFYMRLNEDGRTVAAMDVLVPRVGELIGGSQREERLDALLQRLDDGGMDHAAYQGYLDLRRFGTVPHAGFGLGFERLVLFATGLDNIREVIPFPRWPGHAEY